SGVSTILFNVSFLDSRTGFCAGASGIILSTADGGSSWSRTSLGTPLNVYVVTGTSSNSLWAVGDNGLLLHSTTRGTSWESVFGLTTYSFYGLEVVNDSLVWISGDIGTMLSTRGFSLPTSAPPS
ncbi:MAG TPA: hypothetical protein DEP53_01665, partial [Bacteroidetes bacterium]|nr:hypothetical protein [Bacteroidota bacterium]